MCRRQKQCFFCAVRTYAYVQRQFCLRQDCYFMQCLRVAVSFSLSFSTVCCLQVTAQTEEVICCRIQQRNMATTVEKLQLCIPGTTAVCVPSVGCDSFLYILNKISTTDLPKYLDGGHDKSLWNLNIKESYFSTPLLNEWRAIICKGKGNVALPQPIDIPQSVKVDHRHFRFDDNYVFGAKITNFQ